MELANPQKTIAIVAPYFPPEGGGAERYAYEIAARLGKDHGYRIVVITSCHYLTQDYVSVENDMTIYRLAYDFKISNTPFSFKWFHKVKQILNKEKPLALNIHMPVPGLGDIVSFLSRKIPVILNYHSGTMRKAKSNFNFLVFIYESIFLPIIMKKASKIVSDSEVVRQSFLKKYENKSITLTPAANTEAFKVDDTLKPKSPTVLFVAGLNYSEQYKGLEKLLISIVMTKKSIPNIKLNVVGSGDMKDEYVKMCKELGIEDSVTFHGRLAGEALYDQYKKSNILVHPSLNESFSLVILEGMAASLPVIAVNVGGTKDQISDGVDGFILPSNSPELIAEKLVVLFDDNDLRNKFSEAARFKIENKFQWKDRSDVYADILSKLK